MGPAFYKNLLSLMQSIDDCIEKKRTLPALTLIYTAVDVLAGLDRREDEGTQAAFRRWVDNYMVAGLPCNSLDLYGARCAILHAFTAEADIHTRTPARQIYYAWGTGNAERLQETLRRTGSKDAIVLHLSVIRNAFVDGVARFEEELVANPETYEDASLRASLWFTDLEANVVDLFLGDGEAEI